MRWQSTRQPVNLSELGGDKANRGKTNSGTRIRTHNLAALRFRFNGTLPRTDKMILNYK